MRTNIMSRVQQLVWVVFVVGLIAIAVIVGILVTAPEGLSHLIVLAVLAGLAALVLLGGACLALLSIAESARITANALARQAQSGTLPEASKVFGASPLHPAPRQAGSDAQPPAPRPTSKTLVAER